MSKKLKKYTIEATYYHLEDHTIYGTVESSSLESAAKKAKQWANKEIKLRERMGFGPTVGDPDIHVEES